jgi:cell division protein FtsX
VTLIALSRRTEALISWSGLPHVNRISLETEDERVKQFVQSLPLDSEGSVLELDGKPLARVMAIKGEHAPYDSEKLRAAILARRDESRQLNDDWDHAERGR